MAGVRKARGSYAKTADRRSEILDSTMAVFAESGFHGGTIREIADRVGMSQAGLLHHFASKSELLQAVLTHRDELALARMGSPSLPSGAGMLRALVDLSGYNATTPGLVALFAVLSAEGTAPDHPGHAYFQARYAQILEVIEQAISVGQRRGEVRPEVDPGEAARTMIALWDGLQIQWLYAGGGFDMERPLRAYVESLIIPEQSSTTNLLSQDRAS